MTLVMEVTRYYGFNFEKFLWDSGIGLTYVHLYHVKKLKGVVDDRYIYHYLFP